MQQPGTPDAPEPSGASLRTINLLDYLAVLARHKRFIVRFAAAVFVLTALVLFLLVPRWYKSTAVVMPPKNKNSLSLMTSLARATAPLRSLGIGQGSEDLADLQTILASRKVREAVVNKFDLMNVYDLDTMEKALKELATNVTVAPGEEDVSIEIDVLDTEPARAAAMANYFVEMLNQVYLELSVAEARSNRKFLEERYLQNMNDLKKAEEDFRDFQQKYGIYSVPDQMKAAVEAAAALESRIAIEEVKLGILKQTATEENPLRQASEVELRELRQKLSELQYGRGSGKQPSLVFPPFQKAPQVGLEYIRRYRELELQGKLLELLLPLYEQARIEENRNTPSVLVLDTAVPAVRHTKPKRMILIAIATLTAILIGYIIALFRESLARARQTRSTDDEARMALVRRELHWRRLFR